MSSTIHIIELRDEGEALNARIRDYEVRLHAYTTACVQDIDQGQENDENKTLMWRSLSDISNNLTTARASLQIALGICKKLQEKAVDVGVWE